MFIKPKIIALLGSTRKNSTNLNLIKAIVDLSKEKFDFTIFEGLTEIPHFNPDLDSAYPPKQVVDFRKQLKEANGILICTPEYAMGVPGTLKNAIDWTVSSMEFSHKPTALITASSQGEKAHTSLLETLEVIEADITDETQLLVSFAKTKVSQDAKITDQKTLKEVNLLMEAFEKRIDHKN
jgi:chromate reductase, NAD(P)H dehydrogenase (quinone)